MPDKLKTSAADMVAAARARIREIPAAEALALADDPTVRIVDLRDPRELRREGRIPGALHCPRGLLEFWVDPESPYYNEAFGEDRTYLFHCAMGWRSALAVATLQDMGFANAAHISDGFAGWKSAGGPVEGGDG